MSSTTQIEKHLPVNQLNDALTDVLGRAASLHLDASRPTIERSLQHSLGQFVRGYLDGILTLEGRLGILPVTLRPHVAAGLDVTPENLLPHIVRRVSHWRAAIMELLERFDHDWADLRGALDLAADASLSAISPPLGDAHHHGRTVYRVWLTDGQSLIYKPRPVDGEWAFSALLDTLRSEGCQPTFVGCRVVPRNNYGWTAFVPRVYCDTLDEAKAFYRRQGGYLALFWLLGASDAIGDNLVVSRENPIWVDTECLSRPDLCDLLPATTRFPAWIGESMLTTAMVINGAFLDGTLRRVTGLSISCMADRSSLYTDRDVLRRPYLHAVLDGFETVYRWLLDHARTVSALSSALSTTCHVRVLLRATHLYDVMAKLVTAAPASRHDRVWADIRQVLRMGHHPGSGPFPEAVVEAEAAALERGDIPYWFTLITSRDLWEADGSHVPSVARTSCMEYIEQRAARMTEADLARQVWLLESFLSGADKEDVQ